jgi:eukaryotic-like serine/threonine-protein kinase
MPLSLEALMTCASALCSTAMAFGALGAAWRWVSNGANARTAPPGRRRVGPYLLLDRIAAGAMGEVHRARHGATGQMRAVKLLSRHAGERQRLQFEKEARFGERLRHPHKVSVYEHGETPDGTLYFAMDLVEGITLEALVEQEGAQPPSRVVPLLLQLARALADVHDQGFVHRDIKPSNILLCRGSDGGDTAKLLDFGLIKDLAEPCPSESHEAVVGTPLYIAPEALTAPETVNGRTDIYGLGAVAYFLLRGAPVFMGKSVVEVCAHHLLTPPAPLRGAVGGLSRELEELVLQCLAKDPAARPAGARELIRRLRRCPEVEVSRAERGWTANLPLLAYS